MASRRRCSPKVSFASPFDMDMIELAKTKHLLERFNLKLLHKDSEKKVIIFERANLIFAFNFNPYQSFTDYRFEAPPGKYQMILDSDAPKYGGYGRLLPTQMHFTVADKDHKNILSLYLPARSAFVICPTNTN